MGGTSWATEKSFTTLSLADFLSAQIQGDADVAISRRRRRLRIVVDYVGFVFLHEIQKWPLAGVFTGAFLPLRWPQMVSTGCPKVFFLIARFMSSNSTDAGSSIFAATVVLAFFRTGSDASAG